MRGLYQWVIAWAATAHATAALFFIALAESSFFPVPPDPLLLATCLARPKRAFHLALTCTVGSVLGGVAGYFIGHWLWQAVSGFFFNHVPGFDPETFDRVARLYKEWDFWAVFIAGLTPIPYKLFTIAGGVFGISLPVFTVASILSRGARFFAEAYLIWRYGAAVSAFIDKYFNAMSILFAALLVGGFLVVRYVL